MVRETNFKALDDFIDLSTQDALKTIDGITPEDLREAAIAIAKNPPAKEKLQEISNKDIENLINDFNSAEKLYNQIHTELSSVDSYEIEGEKTTWASEWKDLWMEFTDLTSKSKEVAASLSHFARRHVQVVLPCLASKDNTLEHKKLLIKQTINTIEKRKVEAEKFSKDFKSHKAECITFKSKFEVWAKKREQTIIQKIADVNSEIQHIRAEIKNLDVKITGLAIGICLSIFAVATTSLLDFCNPWFGISTSIFVTSIIGSVALSALISKRSDLQHNLNEKNSELSKLEQQQQSVRNALVVSASLDAKLQNIYNFCDFFVNFWQCTASKLQKCLDQELDLEGDLESPLGILPNDYKLTENLWNVLADSLDMYSSGGISGSK